MEDKVQEFECQTCGEICENWCECDLCGHDDLRSLDTDH